MDAWCRFMSDSLQNKLRTQKDQVEKKNWVLGTPQHPGSVPMN